MQTITRKSYRGQEIKKSGFFRHPTKNSLTYYGSALLGALFSLEIEYKSYFTFSFTLSGGTHTEFGNNPGCEI